MKNNENNVQLEHKIKTTSYISLPYQLVEDIKSLKLSKQYEGYAYKFIGIIMRNNWLDDKNIFDYTEISSKYIQKVFNSLHYTKWINPMLELEIIQRDNLFYFGNEGNKSLYYKINNKYFNSLVLIDTIDNKPLQTVSYSDITTLNFKDKKYLDWFKSDMETIDIDVEKMNVIMNKKIDSVKPSDFYVNEDIVERTIQLNYDKQKFFISREKAIEKAKNLNLDLIKDGKRYVIDSLEAHIAKKKDSLRISYSNAILDLKMNKLRATRNTTNNRLDTNITNLCADLTDEICNNNNLIQIDLNNSQFALLSHWLTGTLDTSDFKLFKSLSISGELYDYIKDKLSLKSRKEGKIAMFEILFSSRKNNTPNKKMLKEIFPTVIKWIDDYKSVNGDEAFSVALQKLESKIFIDTILTKIKKNKLFCITKHDSVILKNENKEQILEIINEEFNKIGLEHKLDIKSPKVDITNELLEKLNDYSFRQSDHIKLMTQAITSGSINNHYIFDERIILLKAKLK